MNGAMLSTDPRTDQRHYQPPPVQPPRFHVKNTFIDVQEHGADHDDGVDLNRFCIDMTRRQVSDPGSTCLVRQLSGGPAPLSRTPEDEVVERGHGNAFSTQAATGAPPRGAVLQIHSALQGGGAAPPQAARDWPTSGQAGGYRADGCLPPHFVAPPPAAPPPAAPHCVGRAAQVQSAGLPSEWREAHTVMMRNLPNKYTQQMLLSEVNQAGFQGSFDFLYLPIDPETGVNRGYAFINFTQPRYAFMFKQTYEGRKMSSFNSSKIVGVMPAALQGFQANYNHYSTARVNRGDPSTRPLFLREPDPSDSAPEGAGSRRGRRRRGGGASAIDLATRQQQRQRNVLERQQREEQCQAADESSVWVDSLVATAVPGVVAEAAPHARTLPPAEEAPVPRQWTANFCPQCGEKVQAHFQFCANCGASTTMPNQPPKQLCKMGEEAPMGAAPPAPTYYMVMPGCYPDAGPPNSRSTAAAWLAA